MLEVTPGWRCAVVVCCNERPPGHPRGSCGERNGVALRDWLRDRARAEGQRGAIVVHRGGCMDVCGQGTTVAVHGEGGRRVLCVRDGDRELLWAAVVASVTR